MPPKVDVRRLLKKQQAERSNKTTRVTHPFAKYDQTGRLICVVCNAPVKSETVVWQAHLGSPHHRDNIQKLKALKQQQLKRPASSPSPASDDSNESQHKRMRMEQNKEDIELDEPLSEGEEEEEEEEEGAASALPSDFFDNPEDSTPQQETQEEPVEENTKGLPAGFFDDPEEDARVQGELPPEEQAKANLERDLASFNEDMMDVTKEAREEQGEDDESLWRERHLDLVVGEQAVLYSRVEKLKQMRQQGDMSIVVNQQHQHQSVTEDDDDGMRIELKSSVRQVLKKNSNTNKAADMVVDSMFSDEDEESDEDDWRAQQL
ncbi:MAG: hypothetical protein EXX96DRAFT_587803 [Benjaminiella poitrasii]|nr:MAG: hypothetical protein EXX96DRAFT_587803 [Benjaminiella poitrasii]